MYDNIIYLNEAEYISLLESNFENDLKNIKSKKDVDKLIKDVETGLSNISEDKRRDAIKKYMIKTLSLFGGYATVMVTTGAALTAHPVAAIIIYGVTSISYTLLQLFITAPGTDAEKYNDLKSISKECDKVIKKLKGSNKTKEIKKYQEIQDKVEKTMKKYEYNKQRHGNKVKYKNMSSEEIEQMQKRKEYDNKKSTNESSLFDFELL